ncbi:hypothetical protein B0H67DRAFT_648855 [Lasiosphaeris hirsuta]|uniref:Uncharacterized protein n=1 Tax=Lasiosphaeris hirsuta TaxID=260670 RepID=A0AA39ZVD5_9PEZI|nr:hypothetical protein B0H67DRAFT_648855 [Lasiosphaeris hirsuta]
MSARTLDFSFKQAAQDAALAAYHKSKMESGNVPFPAICDPEAYLAWQARQIQKAKEREETDRAKEREDADRAYQAELRAHRQAEFYRQARAWAMSDVEPPAQFKRVTFDTSLVPQRPVTAANADYVEYSRVRRRQSAILRTMDVFGPDTESTGTSEDDPFAQPEAKPASQDEVQLAIRGKKPAANLRATPEALDNRYERAGNTGPDGRMAKRFCRSRENTSSPPADETLTMRRYDPGRLSMRSPADFDNYSRRPRIVDFNRDYHFAPLPIPPKPKNLLKARRPNPGESDDKVVVKKDSKPIKSHSLNYGAAMDWE